MSKISYMHIMLRFQNIVFMPLFKFWIIRHSQVQNTEKIYGSTDIAPTNFNLKDLHFSVVDIPKDITIYSSPYLRTTYTVMLIKNELGLSNEIIMDDRISEQNFGEWEGLDTSQVSRSYLYQRNYSHFDPDISAPSGEQFSDVRKRASEFFNELINVESDKHYLICTHGGFIRAMLANILDLTSEKALIFDLKPLSITKLEYGLNQRSQMLWWIKSIGLTKI